MPVDPAGIRQDCYFRYKLADLDNLRRVEPKLAPIIDAAGPIRRRVFPNLFHAFIRMILGQQINSRLHETLWQRFLQQFGACAPMELARLPVEDIKSLGTSCRKAACIKGIASAFTTGAINGNELNRLDNLSLVQKLVALPGVGPWTADMLLIFTFQRPDVISFHDLGIRKALMRLHGLQHLNSGSFIELTSNYGRLATLASFYLWEAAAAKSLPRPGAALAN